MVMRLRLSRHGWPQVVVFPAVVLTVMTLCPLAIGSLLPVWAVCLIEVILAVVLVWILAFFRDPYRLSPQDKNILLAPADGKITDIEMIKENEFIGGPAVKIGIFLSIFDAHINRAPCNVRVEKITYKKGRYKNAADPRSSQVNESNDLELLRTDDPKDRLIVRQISGAIARRIVCTATAGQKLSGGEDFGMIKFGSRTELYLPARENVKPLVKPGDKVKAGLTIVARYEKCPD